MENLEQKSIFNLQVTPETTSVLAGLSQWIIINAILGFASAGLSVITTIISISRISGTFKAGAQIGSLLFGVVITLGISLLLNITLYASGNFLKTAAQSADQAAFNNGTLKLASYFKIFGIIMIVACALVVIVFFGALSMGNARY